MSDNSTNTTLHIEGMDCSSCALGIAKTLEEQGLENVHVAFATGEATFDLGDAGKLPAIEKSIEAIGYKVVDSDFQSRQEGKLSRVEKLFYISLPFTVVLFVGHMMLSHHNIINSPEVQFLLCLPVYIIGVIQFGKSAWGSLKTGIPNMDVLIFIGSSSAFIYSLIGIYWYYGSDDLHNYLFFETAATIITLVLLGNVLEHRSVSQTTMAIQELSSIQVQQANIVSLSLGKEVISPIDYKDIPMGAILQVNTGDKVPVDGEIVSGDASIDEAMITGESLPVDKGEGSKVIGGTILLNGSFRMRAESIGGDTMLSKIIALVKKAQQEKPEIQKIGDKVSAVFVPIVLSVAIITFVTNYFFIEFSENIDVFQEAMMRSIAVMVISCPCAMGLAAPTAVMVGIGRAAKNGILIKGGSTLQKFASIKNIVFDKTGTLTTGNFKIKGINCEPNVKREEVEQLLFAMEQHSSHPIAKSIVNELKGINVDIKISDVKEVKGLGLTAMLGGDSYELGSKKLIRNTEATIAHNLYLLKNKELLATVDLQDDIKENVTATIGTLKRNGVRTIMLSGDAADKCAVVAEQVKIDEVYSEQLPDQKLELIDELTEKGLTAMVGDGINDAPALAKATVGVSIGNATQAAIQSAQIVLLKNNDLSILTEAHLISKHTLTTIKQNFFWAFFYNVIAIPFAAAGFLSPTMGALTMAFSDIVVIGNSIRLKTKKLR